MQNDIYARLEDARRRSANRLGKKKLLELQDQSSDVYEPTNVDDDVDPDLDADSEEHGPFSSVKKEHNLSPASPTYAASNEKNTSYERKLDLNVGNKQHKSEDDKKNQLKLDLSNSKNSSSDFGSPVLLIMEVVIGDGRKEPIEIRHGDNASALAEKFARKHNLNNSIQLKLIEHIQKQINIVEKEKNYLNTSTRSDIEPEEEEVDQYNMDALQSPDKQKELTEKIGDMNSSKEHLARSYSSELDREERYNQLMSQYGHYCQASKVNSPSNHLSSPSNSDIYSKVGNIENSFSPKRVAADKSMNSSKGVSVGKNSARDKDVYNRLYGLAAVREKWYQKAVSNKKNAEVHQTTQKKFVIERSKQMNANRTNGKYRNIGERLYGEALADMQKKDEKTYTRNLEREMDTEWICPRCSFVNNINKPTCENTVPTYSKNNTVVTSSSNTTNRLCNQMKPALFTPTILSPNGIHRGPNESHTQLLHLKRQKARQKAKNMFDVECTFTPKINEYSSELDLEKRKREKESSVDLETKTRFEILFENAERKEAIRLEKELDFYGQYPFKPEIGVNAFRTSSDKSPQDFINRVAVEDFKDLEKKREHLREKYAQNKDPETGRDFFKPQIGRGPLFNRNEGKLPIGEFLFAARHEFDGLKQQLQKDHEHELKENRERAYLSHNSRVLLETRKKKAFEKIFDTCLAASRIEYDESMKNNGDVTIIPSDIDLSSMDESTAKLVQIVFELSDWMPLSKDCLFSYLNRLLEERAEITYTEVLIPKEAVAVVNNSSEELELTFQPKLDSNSNKLVKNHGRAEKGKVFSNLNNQHNVHERKKELLRKKVDNDLKKECTFKPKLISKYKNNIRSSNLYDKYKPKVSQNSAEHPILKTVPRDVKPYIKPLKPPTCSDSSKNSNGQSKTDKAQSTTNSNKAPNKETIENTIEDIQLIISTI